MLARGEDVVSLCVGEPDFDPPAAILAASHKAVDNGLTRYTAVSGTTPLRKAISKHLLDRKGVAYTIDEILVCNGAKQAVFEAVLATVRPGDEVLIPSPYWPSYPEIVKMAGGTPIIVETAREDGYLLRPEALAAALSAKTRMLIFCNPSNPTGAVHGVAAVEALAAVLATHEHGGQVWVLADEIYERLVYDGAECPAFAAARGGAMWQRTLTVNGFSKAYAMTGFRLGYLAAPERVVRACAKLQGQITSCASSVAQAAGVAALEEVPWRGVLQPLVAELQAKRDMAFARLQGIPGVVLPRSPPAGAFYLLPEVDSFFGRVSGGGSANGAGASSGQAKRKMTKPEAKGRKAGSRGGALLTDSTAFCLALLEEAGVALVPGAAFGTPKTVRISYATGRDDLTRALDRLEEWLSHVE
jgi:aspartate/methionine/tyrosine aminotransferase